MASEPIIWKAPVRFQAGDTLLFQLDLPRWLPSDGWQAQLTIRANTGNGSTQIAQVVSQPDITNQFHVFNIPNFLGNQASGIYTAAIEIINAAGNAGINVAAGEKHLISMQPDFELLDNLTSGANVTAQKTEAQEMIEILRETLKGMYRLKYSETESDRNRFNLKEETKVLDSLKYWKEMRLHEIQMERVRNGQNPQNIVGVRFNIGC